MRISIFGSGYVGLVTGACFAEMGNDVICGDIDERKIAQLRQGISPIYEPGLSELLARNADEGRLSFTTDLAQAVKDSEMVFIAVGTPSCADGSADLSAVMAVARVVGEHMTGHRTIVIKSTVPVGTGAAVHKAVATALAQRRSELTFDVVSNPEFLKEGTAIADCLKPDRVIVGCASAGARERMNALYAPFLKNGNPLIFMDVPSSELTKYAANAMLATKISFMNELSRLCDRVGANVEQIRQGIGSDRRIGHHFIYAGLGYGGSCFPKDVRALIKTAAHHDEDFAILQAVERANLVQRERFVNRLEKHFERSLRGKKIAVWGLAFKPDTDDVREAPALFLIEKLRAQGARIAAFDPIAHETTARQLTDTDGIEFVGNQYDALEDADALCLVTEWKQFREPNFEKMKQKMRTMVIFDGRNIYSPDRIRALGGAYYSIGR